MSKKIKSTTPAPVFVKKRDSIAAKLNNLEYRHAFVEATITQGIAYQIKANRYARNLSQKQLGSKIGKRQSSISKLEDPSYGKFSIRTLLEMAKAFDVALLVKFVPFSKFLIETSAKHPELLVVKSYNHENKCWFLISSDSNNSDSNKESYLPIHIDGESNMLQNFLLCHRETSESETPEYITELKVPSSDLR